VELIVLAQGLLDSLEKHTGHRLNLLENPEDSNPIVKTLGGLPLANRTLEQKTGEDRVVGPPAKQIFGGR
jgi:hypothetical protein